MQNVKGEYVARGKKTPRERGMKNQPRPKKRGSLTEKPSKTQKKRSSLGKPDNKSRKNSKK
jgi:hypothetical protein